MAPRRMLTALVAVSLTGCALLTSVGDLRVVDVGDGDSSSGDAASVDGDAGVSVDATVADSFIQDVAADVVDGCATTNCFDMPAGFSLVALGTRTKGCPLGFGVAADTVEQPTVGANACTCGCTITTAPTCGAGLIVSRFGSAGAGVCGQSGGNMVNNGCGTDGFLGPFSVGNEHRYTPPKALGGACQAPANKDATKLTNTEGRVCQATVLPKCGDKVCPAELSDPFLTCIATAGDVACPAPFAARHLVGTSSSFSCSAGCTCSVEATCTGKLKFFANTTCAGASANEALVNDTCVPTSFEGATYGSHLFDPSTPSATCAKSGSSAATPPTLNQPTTVCCK